MRVPRALGLTALALIGTFWIAVVLFPLLAVLGRARDFSALLDPSILAVFKVTAEQAFLSVLLASAFGLPLGVFIGTAGGSGRAWAERCLSIPSGVPSIVASFAWVTWLGRSGWFARMGVPLDWSYSLKAVILAHVFFNAPWIALLVAQARARIPEREVEAARTLGAGNWNIFKFIIFPRVRFAFFSAAVQALSFCVMSFALVMILGGGPPVETLETALYSRIRFGSLDLSGAVACGIWELVLTLPPWVLVLYWRSRERAFLSPGQPSVQGRPGATGFFAVLFAVLFVSPYLVVFSGPLLPTSDFKTGLLSAFAVSARLAFSTAFFSTAAAVLAVLALSFLREVWKGTENVVSGLLLLPAGISAMVLGLGLWLAYGQWIDPFAGSLAAMVLLQTALFFPVAFRILWPVAQEFPQRQFEAALTLGASPGRAFLSVDWPRWKDPIRVAFAIVAAASLGEVAAVSLFYSENLIPLPLLVSRLMSQYRFEEARSVSALLFFLSVLTIIFVTQSRSLRGANPRPI